MKPALKLPRLVALALLASLATAFVPAAAAQPPLASVPARGAPGAAYESSLDGVVEAVRQATLSAQVAGAIVTLNVKVGDQVRAGQELLRLDARAARQNVEGSAAQVEAARASLEVAAKELERQKQLYQKEYISQAALDRYQAQWQAAQAQLNALDAQTRAARTQSGFFVIQAPFAGVVSEVLVTLGDMAMPGSPLVKMHDPSALRVTAAVAQTTVNALGAAIQGARYELPGIPGHEGPRAPVSTRLLPVVDASTHTAQLRLELPAGTGAAPGMFARVWLPASANASQDAVARVYVPASAVVRRGEMTGVYVLDAEGAPRLRQVRLGRVSGDSVEILTGVSLGEQVASDPQAAGRAR